MIMTKEEAMQRAIEARIASVGTLTTRSTYFHLDDISSIDLSCVKIAEEVDAHPEKLVKGCKFCQGETVKEWGCLGRSRKGYLKYGYKESVKPIDFGETCDLTITGRTLHVDYNAYSCDSSFNDEIAINFCPMCGKKLNMVES